MIRRIAAMAAILAVLALVGALVWQVYLHHLESGGATDPTTLVQLPQRGGA